MKNEKNLSFLSKRLCFSIFAVLSLIAACGSPLFYLYIDEEQKMNGFAYFANTYPLNFLMLFCLICLVLSTLFSLLALLEMKIHIKRKLTEIGLCFSLIEAFLYTAFTFSTIEGNQTTFAPYSLFFAFLIFLIYNTVMDFI